MSPFFSRSSAALCVLPLALQAVACVWANGNPEIAPLRTEGNVVSALPLPPVGWSARIAPTPAEDDQLQSLRDAARLQRDASFATREAEHAACAGLSADDRDISPFFYRRDIQDVVPVRASEGPYPGRIEGAVVTFRRVEGLTPSRLQRLMDCQTARYEAAEYAAPEARWCPLAVRGVLAHVVRDGRGLKVRLLSGDPDAAAEAYVRALALR